MSLCKATNYCMDILLNPIDSGDQFTLSLRNPRPKARRIKGGPIYLVEFEVCREEWELFMEASTQGVVIEAVACVEKQPDAAALAQASPPHQYGAEAKELRQSGFFRVPAVWQQVGSDADYLAWVRDQHCAYCGTETGIDPAHVRRIASGAGTAVKPEYSAIPLCRQHHRLQHDHGESAVGGKEWCDKQRIQHVEQWAWEALRAMLGAQHWYDVPPPALARWATAQGVYDYLPEVYRAAIMPPSAHTKDKSCDQN